MRGFTVQFNWIFVVIAGGLILAFFFGVAMKQRSLSEEKLSVTLSADLENILTAAIVSKGTAQLLPVPSKGLSFACSKGCDCRFSVGRASKSFSDMIIFAPAELERDGVVWSVAYNSPYRIANLLLITSPDIKYYFVGQSALLNKVVSKLPPQITYEVVSSVSEVDDEYDNVRFVFFSGVESPPDFLKGSSAISLSGHLVEFYEQDRDDWVRVDAVPYPGFDLFLGSIFSADDVMFECDLRHAFRKASNVAGVMSARASELQRVASFYNSSCYYDGAVSLLDDQAIVAKGLASQFSVNGLNEFNSLSSQVEQVNRQLVQRSCPGLY